jgi:D-glycerate 3-kinase
MKVAQLVAREVTPAWNDCLSTLDPNAPSDYRELAALLACEWRRTRPRFVGLAGGQGAGKSTLGRLIASACEWAGLRTCVLALDDFYFPLEVRRELAQTVHPLFETRGPPGTHDMRLCRQKMERLVAKSDSDQPTRFELPIFDKGLDDRAGSRWVSGPFDIVVLEGWCVGAESVDPASLEGPINALESERDADGRWRQFVNDRLGDDYARTWEMIEALVYLKVPDLDAVRRWRLQQEEGVPVSRRLDAEAIDLFVEYYERVTLAMMELLPARADLTVELASDHSIAALRLRGDRREVRPGG